jgi:hypothetical protein
VVLKPTHLSGWTRRLTAPPGPGEREELIAEIGAALRLNHGRRMAEPGYYNVPARIVIEPYLEDANGGSVSDYKFWVFRGRVAFVQHVRDRMGNQRRAFYDPDWRRLALDVGPPLPQDEGAPPPVNLERMLDIAETLAAASDFLRIDLYETRGRLYFGEVTVYSHAGLEPYRPPSFDRLLGDIWRGRVKIGSPAELQKALSPFYWEDD